MSFVEKETLKVNQYPNGYYEKSLNKDESLLVMKTPIFSWIDDENNYGYYRNWLYPAYHNGKKAWLREKDWSHNSPYSANGGDESILEFKYGVELLLSHGAYEHLFNK